MHRVLLAIMLLFGHVAFAQKGDADPPSNPKKVYRSIVVVDSKGEVCRAWFLPLDAKKDPIRWKRGKVPGACMEEWGLIILGGRVRLREISFEDVSVAPRLSALDLADLEIDDAEFAKPNDCRSLEELILSGNSISDKSINPITRLKNLNTVNIHETGISKSGVERLMVNRPDLKIIVDKRTYVDATYDGYRQIKLDEETKP